MSRLPTATPTADHAPASERPPAARRPRVRARRVRAVAAVVVAACATTAVAPGGSAAGPVAAAADEYVALGDSYSSGLGAGEEVDGACHRSAAAFPARLAEARPGTTVTTVACAGATVADVERTQLDALSPATALVTLTVGGNDAGFSKVVTRCALPAWVARCSPPVARARRFVRGALPARLDRLYRTIHARAPAATVVVVGYPRLLNGVDCGPVTFFSRGDARLLNGTADLLRDVLRGRALAAGFRFADVIPAFAGHAVCDEPEWLNGLSAPLRESFHPNAAGHAFGYAPTILGALG